MSLKRSLTAPPSSSLSTLTQFPTSSPPISKRSLPTSAHHYRPRSNSRSTTKASLSRVTSRVHVAQEDPFNCSGFFPGQSTASVSAADWNWVRSGNDDEDQDIGDGDNKPAGRRPRPALFLLNDDEDGLATFSPDSESVSLPITPAAPPQSLLSPLANEFDDEFTKRINDEDKMGVLRMTLSASRLFAPNPKHTSNPSYSHSLPLPLPLSSPDDEATDPESLHTLISSRRRQLTTSNLTPSQSDPNLKSTLFSPVDDDDVEEWNGGERVLRKLGGYVENVMRSVGI